MMTSVQLILYVANFSPGRAFFGILLVRLNHGLLNGIYLKLYIFLFQPIDYEAFHLFVDHYLEVETPEELCRHLFLSFIKRPAAIQPPRPPPLLLHGKERSIKDIAAISAQTICAPVTTLTAESAGTIGAGGGAEGDQNDGSATPGGGVSSAKQIIADKLHGLSERIHQLGHMRSDSGSGVSVDGKRSRAGQ